MKKIQNIFLCLSAAFALVSCEKDGVKVNESPSFFMKGTAEQVDKVGFVWDKGDAVSILSAHSKAYVYALAEGEGTADGRFGTARKPDYGADDTYFAFYPASMVSPSEEMDGGIVFNWPSEQRFALETRPVAPMCCTGTVKGTALADGTFYYLGGLLSVDITIPEDAVSVYANKMTIASMDDITGEFSAQEYESGYCRVARIKSGKGGKSISVALEGEDERGVYMESGHTYHCLVSMPESASDGYDDIVIDIYDCNDYNLAHIEYGESVVVTRGKVSAIEVTVEADATAYGIYSVSESKKVKFSQGCLYVRHADGKYFYGIDPYMVDFTEQRNPDHTNTFFWSSNMDYACAAEYSDDARSVSDMLFTESSANHIELCGMTWRVLSFEEWDYLLNRRTMNENVPRYIAHDDGLRIYPDDYKDGDQHVTLSYTCKLGIYSYGFYWMSDSFSLTKAGIGEGPLEEQDNAMALIFKKEPYNPESGSFTYSAVLRNRPCAIRLVTDVE